jgi:cysteine-rich repeat protein
LSSSSDTSSTSSLIVAVASSESSLSEVSSIATVSSAASSSNDSFDGTGGCGNGTVERTEECDDGNRASDDGCSASCTVEDTITLVAAASVCGNGTLEEPEECDNSNRRDNDGCSSTCLLEIGICGDGVIQKLLGEQCEDALHDVTLPYQCEDCQLVTHSCGDGKQTAGEACDSGVLNANAPDVCRPDCSLPRCGDGVQDSSETCDDNNRKDSDGCDRYCRVEVPEEIVEEPKTQIAADIVEPSAQVLATATQQPQQFQFPQYPTQQPVPYQLPYAQLQPLIQSQQPIGDTGPAAVAVIGAGAASGLAWMRRKKRL